MASVPGNHTGILREENLILRQILGYHLESVQQPNSPLPVIGQYLPGTSIKDVLFVSIDVDTGGGYEDISPGQSFHIGISIFDTRCLTKPKPFNNPQNIITSYQFINRDDTRPCKWAAKSFLFGETELISLPSLVTRFSLLTQGRDYIIIAHGVREDIKFFNHLDPNIANQACYILDTVKAAQYPLQLYYRYSMEKLLDEFKIPYANLHAAGNDAHFALKAMFMIAVRDGQRSLQTTTGTGTTMTTTVNQELICALDTFAHAPVRFPCWIEKPPPPPARVNTKKLGIKAKRRLRAARKAAAQIHRELPYAEESDGQDGDEVGEPKLLQP